SQTPTVPVQPVLPPVSNNPTPGTSPTATAPPIANNPGDGGTGTSNNANQIVSVNVNGTNNPSDVTITVGQTITIQSVATNIGGAEVNGAQLVYTSSDSAIVRVTSFDATGRTAQVAGLAIGSAFVTVASTNSDGTGALV